MPGDAPEQTVLDELFYQRDSVRFVHWRQFSGAKATVLLVGAIAILSFVTGLSNLSQPSISLGGPLAKVLPWARSLARFGGVLFAFLLGVLTVFLHRGKRIAWYGAVSVLALLALLPLVTLRSTDVPLLLLIVITEPLLIWNRSRFDRSLDLSPLQIASLSSILGVLAYGSIGSFTLRRQFTEMKTAGDAVYYVIVTIATVGYGDITPQTSLAQWFSLSVIVFGTGAFTAAIGAIAVPAIESRLTAAFGNMTASELKLLEDHVLVLGHGEIVDPLVDELDDQVDIVLITQDAGITSQLNDDEINVITDEPSDEDVLLDASIEAARGAVVATHDDARDVLSIIAAREANSDIRIVAAANQEKHAEKLQRVGADEVVSPMSIAGKLLGQSVLGKSSSDDLIKEPAAPEDEK